ncbi:MAG: hypothetical protein HY293_07520 [Planctomycetes bacterium]|nr:hypothetical protein [Planctomycetota bacterium]
MRILAPLAALALLASCAGDASRVERVPEDLRRPRLVTPRVPDRHPFGDVTKLRTGQWATYREGDRTFTLAAVGTSGDSVWIELIEEGDPRQVSARLVGPDGVVHKAFYGEISKAGEKSSVEPQTLDQNAAAPPAKLGESGRETGEETVIVGGRELRARKVSVRSEDLEGRLTREVTLWHPDVPPIYAGSEGGGLVRRESGGSKVELTAFGADAKALLEPPK